MRILVLSAFFVLTFALTPMSSSTAEVDYDSSGNSLILECGVLIRSVDDPTFHENTFESFQHGFCTGLVTGISYGSPDICPPKGVTVLQEVRIVEKYLQDHPEQLQKKNAYLVNEALSKTFFCKK